MTIRIWFPNYYTEAHRDEESRLKLVKCLEDEGIECARNIDKQCVITFCGSFMIFRQDILKGSSLPVVHYNWDLYPFQINGARGNRMYGNKWIEYVKELKSSRTISILVPSNCTAERTRQYVNRESIVIKSPVKVFDIESDNGDYVLDAMRIYPDPNANIVERACRQLNIKFIQTKNKLEWEQYKKVVANCRFLVSANYEASTGGLSSLEAYALGKPVLLSNSPMHGGVDYFGNRAIYFQWNDFNDLKNKIVELYEFTKDQTKIDKIEQKKWVESEYSENRFAKELANHFKEIIVKAKETNNTSNNIHPIHISKLNLPFDIPKYVIHSKYGHLMFRIAPGGSVEIVDIRIYREGHRRKGHGKELFKKMLDNNAIKDASKLYVFTRESNIIAQTFYEKLGFKKECIIKEFYNRTEIESNAVLYTLEINK